MEFGANFSKKEGLALPLFPSQIFLSMSIESVQSHLFFENVTRCLAFRV